MKETNIYVSEFDIHHVPIPPTCMISTKQITTSCLKSLNTKKDHDILSWKSRALFGTGTKMCAGLNRLIGPNPPLLDNGISYSNIDINKRRKKNLHRLAFISMFLFHSRSSQ